MSGHAKISLGVLETGSPPGPLAEPFGSYPAMFQRLLGEADFRYTSFDVRAGALPSTADACAAYVVTGSASGAYDETAWIVALQGFLRAARGRAALVGVCFGHQVMAQAFGGLVVKSPKGWGIGLHDYEVRTGEAWMTPGPVISAPASHQDQVVAPPPAARVLAGSDFCPNGMLAYDEQPAISIQLHPEFEPAYAKALIEARRGRVHEESVAEAAIASLDLHNDCARLGAWIGQFLRERASMSAGGG